MKRQRFEGHEVVEIDCRVTGGVGDGRLNRKLTNGDRVVLVAEGVVHSVAHVTKEAGLTRVQTIRASEGFVLDDELDADDLLHKLRADRKRALDELLGTPPLPGMEEEIE